MIVQDRNAGKVLTKYCCLVIHTHADITGVGFRGRHLTFECRPKKEVLFSVFIFRHVLLNTINRAFMRCTLQTAAAAGRDSKDGFGRLVEPEWLRTSSTRKGGEAGVLTERVYPMEVGSIWNGKDTQSSTKNIQLKCNL